MQNSTRLLSLFTESHFKVQYVKLDMSPTWVGSVWYLFPHQDLRQSEYKVYRNYWQKLNPTTKTHPNGKSVFQTGVLRDFWLRPRINTLLFFLCSIYISGIKPPKIHNRDIFFLPCVSLQYFAFSRNTIYPYQLLWGNTKVLHK